MKGTITFEPKEPAVPSVVTGHDYWWNPLTTETFVFRDGSWKKDESPPFSVKLVPEGYKVEANGNS